MVRDILRANVALVGDDKIGKTKLLNTYIDSSDSWDNNYLMTIEIDLKVIAINIPDTNYCVELQIFDFGGNDLFSAGGDDNNINIHRKYLQLTDHVIAAYNISSRRSFDALKSNWLKQFKATHINTSHNGVILGLQSDLSSYSTVNPKEAIKLAKEHNYVAMQCSSKTNQDVEMPFAYLAQQVYLRHNNNQEDCKE